MVVPLVCHPNFLTGLAREFWCLLSHVSLLWAEFFCIYRLPCFPPLLENGVKTFKLHVHGESAFLFQFWTSWEQNTQSLGHSLFFSSVGLRSGCLRYSLSGGYFLSRLQHWARCGEVWLCYGKLRAQDLFKSVFRNHFTTVTAVSLWGGKVGWCPSDRSNGVCGYGICFWSLKESNGKKV